MLICTDSKSLCQKLRGNSLYIADLRHVFFNVPGTVTIQGVPGHYDIPGNELADEAAKEATSLDKFCKIDMHDLAPKPIIF